MKKLISNKKTLIIILLVMIAVLAGCQRNVDQSGATLPEKIIYLSTPWKAMLDESFFTAIFVYPLAQCVNFIGTKLNSSFLGIVITTILFNVITLSFTVKSTISSQKIQMLQPELTKIQVKYEGRDDDNAKMMQAQEMQALYAKHGVNPLGSLVTPMLQIPIMISMFYAVQRADVVCNGSFLGIPLSTRPSAAFKDLSTGWPIAVLFVLMAIAQLLSTKIPQILAEKKKKEAKNYRAYKEEGQQSPNNNMMVYSMVAMVVLLGLNWPAAMTVYWLVSAVANIIKTLYIQMRYIDNE
ncbi:MAG: YidC/Oxa1 family membrane protein insertase [Erysipelotrichia bacterium]|jgi:YidC/Oxa1 family membrane protein insertase|nr:YidC/Oxa1 family membrane protein insertase [Erysipelotrichia bacterium]